MVRNLLLFVFALSNSEFCIATDQVGDAIVVDGQQQYVRENPLIGFWTRENRPRFDPVSTGNWKGYTSRWEIRDSTLFLTSFDAKIDGKRVDASSIFGAQGLPIPAIWFTGKLTAVRGGFPMPSDKPHFAPASLHLVEHGKVRQTRYVARMRIRPIRRFESSIKRRTEPRGPGR